MEKVKVKKYQKQSSDFVFKEGDYVRDKRGNIGVIEATTYVSHPEYMVTSSHAKIKSGTMAMVAWEEEDPEGWNQRKI